MNLKARTSLTSQSMAALSEIFGPRLQQDVSLARYTSARVGGPAKAFLVVETGTELVDAAMHLWELGLPFMVLGNGSNILVSDSGIDEVVVLNNARLVRFNDQAEPVTVWAESGASLGLVARKAAAQGYSGMEWAVGIPGTIGGAIVGNAGTKDGDTAGKLILAEILHPTGLEPSNRGPILREEWPVSKLEYAYRTSILKRQPGPVVLAGLFKLEREDPETILATMEAYNERRKRTQPPGASMGSMFKNPPDDFSGRLIDACGLKGTRIGDAEISSVHANFFINRGQATAADIRGLLQLAQAEVAAKFGIQLELEIEIVGNWAANG